jgi:serine/threonine protein kinase
LVGLLLFSLVLELADEGDLGDLIKDCLKRSQKLKEEQIWVIIEQISLGLHYLHSNSVLHRDIKV